MKKPYGALLILLVAAAASIAFAQAADPYAAITEKLQSEVKMLSDDSGVT